MIVYFTGTGNSRYCAQMLADKLDDECIDAFHFIRDGIAAKLISEMPWVFVSPTYGWQLPHVFMDFIRSGFFQGSKDAYFVMTCGGDIGNASPKNRALCVEKGLRYRGTLEVVMPENYIALFDAPEEDEARKIIVAASPVLEKGIVGEVYNVGGNNEKANIEIVKLILSRMGKDESLITHVKDRPGHDRRYAIDNTKITTQLGWEPAYSFEAGMAKTIDWYLSHEEWMRGVTSGAYLTYYEKMYS